jgi:hypothetical protein
MWPWGHAAVAYLLYSLGLRTFRDRSPRTVPALAVVFGAVVADLVDKPLAWSVSVLPTGRSLAHSLLFIVPVVAVLWWLFREQHAATVAAFGTGWVSHPIADGVGVSDPAYFGYMLWPLTTTPPYSTAQSFGAHFANIDLTPLFLAQIVLVVCAVVLWSFDGYPGLSGLRPGKPDPDNA